MSAYVWGWLATALYLSAQAYISFNSKYNHSVYYGLNIVAGIILAAASVVIVSWQAVIINIYWALISLLSLLGLLSRTKLVIPRSVSLLCAALIVLICVIWAVWDSDLDFINAVGWIGTFLYCGSYFLLSTDSLSRIGYLWISAFSGCLLLPAYVQADNWPSLTLNIVWAIISVIGICRNNSDPGRYIIPAKNTDG